MCPIYRHGEKGCKANILHSEVTPSGKSFINIISINNPKTDPCGTPAEIFFHEDICPFEMPHCC